MFESMGDKLGDILKFVFADVYLWIIKPLQDIKMFETLIYGKDGEDFLVFGVFTSEEMEKIFQPGLTYFTAVAIATILIGVMFGGMKISSVGINPSNRTYAIEFMKDLAIVAIVLFNLPTLYMCLFGINYMITDLFNPKSTEALIEFKKELDPQNNDVLGQALIGLTLLGLMIWANFYYLMRKVTLIILILLGPLMVAMYLIPGTKGITAGWLKELTGTIFVQSIHAVIFWIISILVTDASGPEAVILYIVFIPLTEALRSLIGLGGDMTNKLNTAGAMLGMSALAGMYGSVKGAMGDKSVMGALKGAYNGTKDSKKGQMDSSDSPDGVKSTMASNSGTDTGSNLSAEKMLKAGEITSKMGKAVFGMAGAVAGSPMGPGGSMLLSTVGFAAGGAVGGIAGRVGTAGVSLGTKGLQQALKGGKQGFKDGKDLFNAESLADDKLANTLADNDTTKWASDNKEQFMKDMKEKFPDAHQSSLDGMWNKNVSTKRDDFLNKARGTVGELKKNDGSFAKGDALASATKDKLTNDWAKSNRDSFMKNFDEKNPVSSNMSEAGIQARNQAKSEAWSDAVSARKEEYSKIANITAGKMSNGLDPSNAYINKDDYSKSVAEQALASDKKDFKSNYRNMEDKAIDSAFEKTNGSEAAYLARAKSASNSINTKSGNKVNGAALASAVTDKLTNDWEKSNQDSFMKEYDKQNPINPNITEADISARNQSKSQAWGAAVSEKRKEYSKIANNATKKMSNGSDPSSANIDREEFSKSVATQAFASDRNAFKTNFRNLNPGASDKDIELEFEKDKGGQKVYLTKAKNAVSGVKTGQLYGRNDVNTPYLASQLATMKTNQKKTQFLNEQKESGVSESDAIKTWSTQEQPGVYKKNLQEASKQIPAHIPLDKTIISNSAVRGVASVASGALSGVVATTGVKEIGGFLKDTKVGKVAIAGAQGAVTGFQQGVSNNSGSVMSSAVSATTGMKNIISQPHVAENILGKQEGFKNAISYTTGIVGGIRGHQMGAKTAMKINPYNKAVNQQVSEVSDISHLAQRDDGNGNMQIAKGAVQLVTTGNQSYVQVRDKTGQTKVVSRYGAGDSSLKTGEMVYQDLNIQDGALVQDSNAYKYDSAGGKINIGRAINVNPSKLLANRNTPKTPRVVQEVQSYNQQVDSGQYYSDDIISKNMKNMKMIVTKERSYMTAQDQSGEIYRVSPYGAGDARLDKDKETEIKCIVKNRRIEKEENSSFATSLQPKDLIPTKSNKRLERRSEFEAIRHKSLGGTM
ncbi:hypothetical protein ACFFIX_20355 [Metabacillus herbersteinensis]|uniref:Type IV secretion system protein n=1 Tax=Metabacillus herbersteinensis TaxID=283816 RepID=A0ABV6GJ62_9BACI